jgi:hypothetical protein
MASLGYIVKPCLKKRKTLNFNNKEATQLKLSKGSK